MRFAVPLLLALAMTTSLSPCFAAEPVAVTLNPQVFLTKDVLTVGDLFQPAGADADHVLSPAPAIGKDLTLNAADLQRVAYIFHLDWHGTDPSLTATIARDAMIVTPDMLATALQQSDLTNKMDPDAEISVQTPADGIMVEGRDAPGIAFENVSLDPLTHNFTATAIVSHPGQAETRTAISGLATHMVDVPVLNTPIERGARIGSGDITTLRLPEHDLRASYATHAEELIGMVTRRSLDANKPLAKNDLTPPVLVHRNEIVTVIYKNGLMALTTKARALANAGKGDTIQLENPSSKKIIEATVTGPQQTTITADSTVAISG